MGHNNNNMRTTWAQQYNNGVVLITIRGYTSSIGTKVTLELLTKRNLENCEFGEVLAD